MKGLPIVGFVLLSVFSTASFAQTAAPGQGEPQGAAAGAVPGQISGAAGAADSVGGPGGPGGISLTTLTVRSYPVAAGAAAGNLEGAVCPAGFKMLSGACHPFYNDHVTIINQFPNIPGNTWRCGFKNNTAAAVTVYIYTLCGQ